MRKAEVPFQLRVRTFDVQQRGDGSVQVEGDSVSVGARGGDEVGELVSEPGGEGDEEREGQEVGVEEVFAPVGGAVLRVGRLHVEAHDGGEDLGDKEDEEAREEGGGVGGGV